MNEMTKKRIHLLYGIILSASIVLAGICIMVACYGIYTNGLASGQQIYSREIVAEAFSAIAIPVYVCLVLVIGGFVLHLALPLERKKLIPEKNESLILRRLQSKKSFAADQTELRCAAEQQQKLRRLHTYISAGLIAVCTIVFLVQACWPGYWPDPRVPDETQDVTEAMIAIMPLFAICVLIHLGYTIFTVYFCRNSIRKEIALYKQATAVAEDAPSLPRRMNKKVLLAIRCGILALSVTLIVIGATTGGVEAIVAKAVAICTECIGLG
jgi:uncharacterized membrane protein